MKIKQIRTKLGLTQGELAEVLGLGSYLRISEYENGVRNPSLQSKILLYCLEHNILSIERLKKITRKIKMQEIRKIISYELLGDASFYYYDDDTDLEYLISNETTEMNELCLTITRNRDDAVLFDESFRNIQTLMNYLDSESIDVEGFQKYNYREGEIIE